MRELSENTVPYSFAAADVAQAGQSVAILYNNQAENPRNHECMYEGMHSLQLLLSQRMCRKAALPLSIVAFFLGYK